MTYTTSSDDIVRKKTAGVFILFAILPLSNLFLSSGNWIWYVGLFGVFMLLLLYTYLHRPTHYEVENNKIVIHRPFGNIVIDAQDIARVDRIHHDLLKDSIKGGAFGYLGKHNTDFGKITFYATRRDNLVMLTKQDKTKIILTPDQVDAFIENIEKQTVANK